MPSVRVTVHAAQHVKCLSRCATSKCYMLTRALKLGFSRILYRLYVKAFCSIATVDELNGNYGRPR